MINRSKASENWINIVNKMTTNHFSLNPEERPGSRTVKVAVLDLNNNEENQGLKYICQLLDKSNRLYANQELSYDVFDVRYKNEIPSIDYDVYISTGGPGSPFDGDGLEWEESYFRLVDQIWLHNQTTTGLKKYMFFICHSFQLMVRHFGLAEVTKRHNKSFGVYPTHKTPAGEEDVLFGSLANPFWIADFRDWQVINPNKERFEELGAKIICLEKIRPHVDFERAVMAIRISDELVGTQFHPEADAEGMLIHFNKPDKKALIIEHHGQEKYELILDQLNDPEKINATHLQILPTFLKEAILVCSGLKREMILF